ncbi:MAG TPA: M28 family metallopeptidase [Candidatus Acidoferrales bacterium]|nr:M28 family metallopeptidase [Candidatus Acidoferrales bacterium]
MRRFARRQVISAATMMILFGALAVAATNDDKAEGHRWWDDVKFLASDDLQGRMTGSAGYQSAAGYVAERFKKEGLTAAGTVGYFQPVEFESHQIDEARTTIEIVQGDKTTDLRLGKEAFLRPAGDTANQIDAGMVFVGYGMSVPEANYDDLAGMDLHGKIAVYLSGGPSTIKDPLRAHEESLGERWKALKAAGAVGIAVVLNPSEQEIPWERIAGNRQRPSLELAEVALRRDPGMQIEMTINPNDADEFFAGSGHTMAEIVAAAKGKKPLPHFAMTATVHARITMDKATLESPNVAGVIEGSDPELKKEYVIVSAHLDHLGVGAAVNGDDVYNGAMDNASGVAALIQIARDFHESGTKPKRSVMFLAVCGEEEGELGSWYFANYPSVPAKNIVADVNMDMFMPLFPLKYLQVQGLDESTLGDDIRAVGKADGINVIEDEQPRANRFIRSDQYSFIQRGVPALAFKFGYVKGSPEEKIFNGWVHTRYHSPSDDMNQKPVDQEAAGKFSHMLFLLADRVADAPARPSWEPTSFFRRFSEEK